jgi:hypothetical protein
MEFDTSIATFLADLAGRLNGPGTLRFVIQPLVALLLGMRDGRGDALAGRPPYGWALVFYSGHRRESARQGALSIAKPFVIALVVDAVLSYLTQGAVHPGETLVVACLLVALPYVVARAGTNRLVRRRHPLRTEPPAPAGGA